tara:strand:+ start:1301 stop:1516 length:216 start_codon:yes stop_codon:yes gene_type:complete
MTVYCIELKTGDTWAPKDIVHCKIPTEDKANARMAELISEGQDASKVRVSVDTTGDTMNPLDTDLGNPTPS